MQQTEIHAPRYCTNCGHCDDFTLGGKCQRCGSDSLVLVENIYPLTAQYNDSVDACEQIWGLTAYEPDPRDEEPWSDTATAIELYRSRIGK